MAKKSIQTGPLVTWSFELQDGIKTLNRSKRSKRRSSHLKTTTQITGYLTKDGLGLVIDPNKDPIEGYYIVLADIYVDESKLTDPDDQDVFFDLFSGFAAVIFKKSMFDEPELIGVFDPDESESWTEKGVYDQTTPATFRFPSQLLEEYRSVCNATNKSQTDALVKQMWNTVRDYRNHRICGKQRLVLGDEMEWDPSSDNIIFFDLPPIPKGSEAER